MSKQGQVLYVEKNSRPGQGGSMQINDGGGENPRGEYNKPNNYNREGGGYRKNQKWENYGGNNAPNYQRGVRKWKRVVKVKYTKEELLRDFDKAPEEFPQVLRKLQEDLKGLIADSTLTPENLRNGLDPKTFKGPGRIAIFWEEPNQNRQGNRGPPQPRDEEVADWDIEPGTEVDLGKSDVAMEARKRLEALKQYRPEMNEGKKHDETEETDFAGDPEKDDLVKNSELHNDFEEGGEFDDIDVQLEKKFGKKKDDVQEDVPEWGEDNVEDIKTSSIKQPETWGAARLQGNNSAIGRPSSNQQMPQQQQMGGMGSNWDNILTSLGAPAMGPGQIGGGLPQPKKNDMNLFSLFGAAGGDGGNLFGANQGGNMAAFIDVPQQQPGKRVQPQQSMGNPGQAFGNFDPFSNVGIQQAPPAQERGQLPPPGPFQVQEMIYQKPLEWHYMDHKKQIYGPFSSVQMDLWYMASHFEDSLPISLNSCITFQPLANITHQMEDYLSFPQKPQQLPPQMPMPVPHQFKPVMGQPQMQQPQRKEQQGNRGQYNNQRGGPQVPPQAFMEMQQQNQRFQQMHQMMGGQPPQMPQAPMQYPQQPAAQPDIGAAQLEQQLRGMLGVSGGQGGLGGLAGLGFLGGPAPEMVRPQQQQHGGRMQGQPEKYNNNRKKQMNPATYNEDFPSLDSLEKGKKA